MQSVEKKLTIIAGVCAVGAGLFLTFPGLNAVAIVVAIAFLTLVIARLGFRRAILIALVGTAAAATTSSLTMGYQAGLIIIPVYVMLIIGPSFLMGYSARRLSAPQTAVALGLIPFGLIFAYFLNFYVRIISKFPSVLDLLYSEMAATISRYPLLAALLGKYVSNSGQETVQLGETAKMIITQAIRVLPGILALGLIGAVLCSFLIAEASSSRFKIMFPRFRPFYMWRASGWWLLLTIAGLVPVVLFKQDFWFYAGINVLIVTGHVYLIVGLAIVDSFFRRSYNPGRLRIIFYLAMILLGIFAPFEPVLFYAGLIILIFLIALGLTDSRFNFKREFLEENND